MPYNSFVVAVSYVIRYVVLRIVEELIRVVVPRIIRRVVRVVEVCPVGLSIVDELIRTGVSSAASRIIGVLVLVGILVRIVLVRAIVAPVGIVVLETEVSATGHFTMHVSARLRDENVGGTYIVCKKARS